MPNYNCFDWYVCEILFSLFLFLKLIWHFSMTFWRSKFYIKTFITFWLIFTTFSILIVGFAVTFNGWWISKPRTITYTKLTKTKQCTSPSRSRKTFTPLSAFIASSQLNWGYLRTPNNHQQQSRCIGFIFNDIFISFDSCSCCELQSQRFFGQSKEIFHHDKILNFWYVRLRVCSS